MEYCDVLVIGAGIAGMSAAYELAETSSVVVLERENQPGYHTTGRSAALYEENYGSKDFRILTRSSYSFLTETPPEITDHPILTPRGTLFFAREDQLSTLELAIEESSGSASPFQRVSTAEAIEITPALKPDYVAAGIFQPDAMDIDVHALHGGYQKGLKHRGGKVSTNAEVLSVAYINNCWHIKTPAGKFSAPIVINAAGAWCDVVAEMAGVRPIGLTPKRRTVLTIDSPQDLDASNWPMTIDMDEDLYFKPDAGQLIVSPADETPSQPCDAQPEELDVAIAIDRLQKATNLKVKRINHKWAGLRSFATDKGPVIGMDQEAPGFFWLAGQGGYGIQTSPAIARATASLVTTGDLPNDLIELGLKKTNLSPERFR